MPRPVKLERRRPWLLIGGVSVVVLFAALLGISSLMRGQVSVPLTPTRVTFNGIAVNGRTLGDPNAPIALVVFSDFQ